jgi:hypothetical protein
MTSPRGVADVLDRHVTFSILQAEFSLTQMLDTPTSGRIFFEQVIRDNLDLGRPDHVGLIFGRRIHNGRKQYTPGRFRTRIITLHQHFGKRKVELGTCGRGYSTPCIHEHACIRCPMLQPDPTQADRLDTIITSLGERIEEARERGWYGEVEGLDVSLAAACDKRQATSDNAWCASPASESRPLAEI